MILKNIPHQCASELYAELSDSVRVHAVVRGTPLPRAIHYRCQTCHEPASFRCGGASVVDGLCSARQQGTAKSDSRRASQHNGTRGGNMNTTGCLTGWSSAQFSICSGYLPGRGRGKHQRVADPGDHGREVATACRKVRTRHASRQASALPQTMLTEQRLQH